MSRLRKPFWSRCWALSHEPAILKPCMGTLMTAHWVAPNFTCKTSQAYCQVVLILWAEADALLHWGLCTVFFSAECTCMKLILWPNNGTEGHARRWSSGQTGNAGSKSTFMKLILRLLHPYWSLTEADPLLKQDSADQSEYIMGMYKTGSTNILPFKKLASAMAAFLFTSSHGNHEIPTHIRPRFSSRPGLEVNFKGGRTAQKARKIIEKTPDVASHHKLVLILLGGNDLTKGRRSVNEVVADLISLEKHFSSLNKEVRLFTLIPRPKEPPQYQEKAKAINKALADHYGRLHQRHTLVRWHRRFLDGDKTRMEMFHTDHIHLSAAGYQVLQQTLDQIQSNWYWSYHC